MSHKNQYSRRSFLLRSSAISAGLAVVGGGIKLHASTSENDPWRWTSYCCVSCDTCAAYLDTSCPSCKSGNPIGNCEVRNCAKNNNNPTCAHCSNLDFCTKLTGERKNDAMQLRATLTSSLNEEIRANLSIHPNPARDFINVKHAVNAPLQFLIIAMNGSVIQEGQLRHKVTRINTEAYPKGSYILQLKNKKQIISATQFVKR